MKSNPKLKCSVWVVAALTGACLFVLTKSPSVRAENDDECNIKDPYIQALSNLTYDQKPPRPVPGVDYGIDPKTGKFSHPRATPLVKDSPSFEGQLEYWDQNSYIDNMELIGTYTEIASPGHSWQNIVDFGECRIMYVYGGRTLKIYDITDPRAAELIHSKGGSWSGAGLSEEVNPFPDNGGFGAASIQWNQELGKLIMVQSFSVARSGVMDDKLKEPDAVDKTRHWPSLKGFRVYEMNGPLPDAWKLLAEVTTDYKHPMRPSDTKAARAPTTCPRTTVASTCSSPPHRTPPTH